ncbi:hypothetical protein SNOG_01741 [Parastagonospora nodorum SN15]|uniref:CID domain-containing protein n=1 Tax=Phaeosphaeria nodorum (strain SN15 / ATCC MYA-4574 / FGSC 10173) TaxID=321614 RepID=Q0V2M3_PHANO|nr:hypothetical protein SNOG_01741 [Parastagonospora nodorum SN15]EAT91390.2 hypothetical protein SNOG_01741 [Parastagonospora nodorum SN15]
MAALEELTTTLQSLSTLKPPGVTPTKVKAITQICVDNIQYDKVLIEKILLQYSNSPATHKLGVLYVVDSVIRQWVEKAKKAGQAVSKQAAPGTYASGVQLVREALPVVLKDLVKNAPETQKEKISKLLDIWQRGQTFPPDMIASMKQLVNGTSNSMFQASIAFVHLTDTDQMLQLHTPPKTEELLCPHCNPWLRSQLSWHSPIHIARDRRMVLSQSDMIQMKVDTEIVAGRLITSVDNLRPLVDHRQMSIAGKAPPMVCGAGGTEGEIRSIFSRFGQVQTCIVNLEKRHAFVKMLTRPDAVHAKEGMDNLQDAVAQSKARQTRWGVGFGPRDCSDYQSGISVIPISRLTDADRKWALTAEHGGTGGRPLEGGMVLEEPDIEIGAGVSSKVAEFLPTLLVVAVVETSMGGEVMARTGTNIASSNSSNNSSNRINNTSINNRTITNRTTAWHMILAMSPHGQSR